MKGRIPQTVALLATTALLLAGCSSPAAKPSPTFSAYPGIDANTLAAHIRGCSDIATSDPGDGSKSGLESAATCTLNGHKIYVASWSAQAQSDLQPLFDQNDYAMYWASGNAWAVFLADDPTPQLQVTNDAGELLKRSLAGETTEINLDAAKTVATQAAADLHGEVLKSHV